MRILWIDDEIHTSASLVAIAQGLEGCGHSVERYDRPDPALDILRSDQFDVIVIDLQLSPGDQDGIETAVEISTSGTNTPIVALTAFEEQFAARIPDADFAAVLNKSDYLGPGDGAEVLARRLTTIVEECETKSEGGASRMVGVSQLLRGARRAVAWWTQPLRELSTGIRCMLARMRLWHMDDLGRVALLETLVRSPLSAFAPVLRT